MLRMLLPSLTLVAAISVADADTLLIDGVEMAQATRSERPARGETKTRVEERFGPPSQMVGAVGEPPISRWEYPGFIVYFEFERVIHAVPRR
jgi:hypothetical protein